MSPVGIGITFLDFEGHMLVGGKLYTYIAGTSTLTATYTDNTLGVPNANPIILNSAGRLPNEIWWNSGTIIKFILTDANGGAVYTLDNIPGLNDAGFVSNSVWVTGPAPTYVSATSFTVVGNQSSILPVGIRIQTTNTSGTIYSTVTASSYSSGTGLTTVTVVNDTGVLDSGLRALNYSIVSPSNSPLPGVLISNGQYTFQNPATFSSTLTLGVYPRGVMQAVHQQGIADYIWGRLYSNGPGDTVNDITITTGGGPSDDASYYITCAAITKRSDAAWAVGTGNGWLDTGSIADGDYYMWDIARSDTNATDSLLSLSATSPTMPTNYDKKNRIGWIKRAGGTILQFHLYETAGGGVEFKYDAPILDVDLTNTLTTTRRTDVLSVPQDFSTVAIVRAYINDASAQAIAVITCPDETDAAPSTSVSPGANIISGSGVTYGNRELMIRTSAAGRIAARATLATVDTYRVWTTGFVWSRR